MYTLVFPYLLEAILEFTDKPEMEPPNVVPCTLSAVDPDHIGSCKKKMKVVTEPWDISHWICLDKTIKNI